MLDLVSSLLFPEKCPYCGATIEFSLINRPTECKSCWSQFPLSPGVHILPCGDRCVSPFRYQGPVRQAIVNYKFSGLRYNAKSFSKAMVQAIRTVGIGFDIITCVPLSESSFKERGYNQSEILAVMISEQTGKPYLHTLKKILQNRIQHELNAADRATNVTGVYEALNIERFAGKRLLLIDDICTTGNTLSECCRVLKEAGAAKTECAAVANAGSFDTLPDGTEDNKEEYGYLFKTADSTY